MDLFFFSILWFLSLLGTPRSFNPRPSVPALPPPASCNLLFKLRDYTWLDIVKPGINTTAPDTFSEPVNSWTIGCLLRPRVLADLNVKMTSRETSSPLQKTTVE